MKDGLVCSLTGKHADFEKECVEFNLDEEAVKANETSNIVLEEEIAELTEKELDYLRGQENFTFGLVGGLIAGLLGAILWGVITVATNFQIGYMAIAIGAGVGLAIRYTGKGVSMIFGITGAVIALLSCFLGNFLSGLGFVANENSLGYIETLMSFDYAYSFELVTTTFSPIDLLFYGIAAYEGFKFSFRNVTAEDLKDM
jgi:hypothetical protein